MNARLRWALTRRFSGSHFALGLSEEVSIREVKLIGAQLSRPKS